MPWTKRLSLDASDNFWRVQIHWMLDMDGRQVLTNTKQEIFALTVSLKSSLVSHCGRLSASDCRPTRHRTCTGKQGMQAQLPLIAGVATFTSWIGCRWQLSIQNLLRGTKHSRPTGEPSSLRRYCHNMIMRVREAL